MTLNWLPRHPDFQPELRAALAVASLPERLERLAALAQHRLGLIEVVQLDRGLRQIASEPVPGFSRVRIAVLASTTVDHLVPAIRVAAIRRRLLLDVHVAPFGQYRQSLLDPQSALHRFGADFVLLSLTAREAIATIDVTSPKATVADRVAQSVDEIRLLWRRARDLKATVIQQNFLDVSEPLFGSHDSVVDAAPSKAIARLNDALSEAAGADGVSILDVARASQRDGLDAWFDIASWLHGKFEVSQPAAPMYGELLARIVAAHRGLSKKCLVLDLDNTLWGGVVGDDGVEGIVLGEGSGRGEAHLALQRYAKQLGERGVILAVCSKNDPAIAADAFERHPEMVLRRSEIAAFVANWEDKSVNLKQIASQLNLGVDSLVFVDDNPAERARVRQSLPSVAVPELPEDVGQYVRCLANAGYFEAVTFTPEDRDRTNQYAANASREALRESSQSLDDFLCGLDMSVMFGPVQNVDIARVAQLINKTNQFNPTTRRYSVDDVAAFAKSEEHLALQFRLIDKFGDNGIVSVMILKTGTEPDVLEIDVWVMSCRVFGRQLEHEVMNIAVEAARQRGARTLIGEHIPTPKNVVVSELYPGLGFKSLPTSAPGAGATRWCLALAGYEHRPTHIAHRVQA